MDRKFYVYIMSNMPNGTLYIGMTNDLLKRVFEHKSDAVESFTKQYQLHKLVWYEEHATLESAYTTEKRMKAWKRDWKINRIVAMNPDWHDLYDTIAHR